jgi:uncharacterized protein involved in response to NO
MAPIPRLKRQDGPALLSYGFRPFFLFGALYAGFAVLAWLPVFTGALSLMTAFGPRDWHVHEMIYGYVPAIVAGFLLTAIPNWTGRLPLQGRPLLVLVLAWLAGRAAVNLSGLIGWALAATIDVGFLVLVAAAAAREIVAGKNWRNLKVVALVSLLAAGNAAFHVEAHLYGTADYATRAGLAVIIVLIMVIGGRIVPSFTRNWLARQNPGRLPAPFGRFDIVAMIASAATLALWVALPLASVTAVALVAAGLLNAVRLVRWAGDRTYGDRLVLVLHLGYAFIPLGFLLLGCAAFDRAPEAAGIHAFAGAVATMTLAVMTRASLGHTGHDLTASWSTQAIYAAVAAATLLRIAAAFLPGVAITLLSLSAAAWAAAFLGFGLVYGPMLVQARRRADTIAAR